MIAQPLLRRSNTNSPSDDGEPRPLPFGVSRGSPERCCASATPGPPEMLRSALFPSFARMMGRMCRVLWEMGEQHNERDH